MARTKAAPTPIELSAPAAIILDEVASLRRLIEQSAGRLSDDDLSALVTPLFHLYSAPGNELYRRRKQEQVAAILTDWNDTP